MMMYYVTYIIRILKDVINNISMNLQEHIRRVIREETKIPLTLLRRFSINELDDEFLESFEFAYNLTKRRKVSTSFFLSELINTTVNVMIDSLHWKLVSTLPDDVFWVDVIRNELENLYRDRIIQMYNETKGINESIPTPLLRIINEETKIPTKLLRRLHYLDYEVDLLMRTITPKATCTFRSGEELLEIVSSTVIKTIYWTYFADVDDNSKEWGMMYRTMVEYINDKYGDKIREYYHINCGN